MKGLAPSLRENRHPAFNTDVGFQKCRVLSGGSVRLLAQAGRERYAIITLSSDIMGQIDGRVNAGLPYYSYEYSKNCPEK